MAAIAAAHGSDGRLAPRRGGLVPTFGGAESLIVNRTPSHPPHLLVIGGGITGLAAAHRAVELCPEARISLVEASNRLGGVLHTERRGPYLLEHSADMFITAQPWALDLCRRVGIDAELQSPSADNRRALIARNGRLHPVPDGFLLMEPRRVWPLIGSPLLSVRGKLRMLAEWFVPRGSGADESLAAFARRRLGREAFERLVQPLASGIYTGDAEQLSLRATLPRFLEMEQQHGGLIRAARRRAPDNDTDANSSGARYGMFVAPRRGMSSLVEAIAARLPAGAMRLGVEVAHLERDADGAWRAATSAGESLVADAVVVAAPARAAARMLDQLDAELARLLAGIPLAGVAIALVSYRRDQLARPINGFGFVVPEIERRPIISASFASEKFSERAPSDRVLVRAFVGGAARPELVGAADEEIERLVAGELGQLLGATGSPERLGIVRWPAAMPQYHLGHLERVAEIERLVAAHPRLALAGNAYRGVGVPYCIRSGELAAQRVLADWVSTAATAASAAATPS